jgi:heme exporter protein A
VQLIAETIELVRGGRAIVHDLSFSVATGETLTLTGANGAGKTTVLRALAGLLPLAGGRLTLEGGDAEREIAESCHYVGHANAVKPNLTVAENLMFWAHYLGAGRSAADVEAAIARALDRLALQPLAELPAQVLSAGQKRRLCLARLLAAARPVWLLDEPTNSLDADSAKALAGLVDEHAAAGGLAVIATHLPLGLRRARELRLGSGEPGHE